MNVEQISCPRCGDAAGLYTSSNGRYLAIHGHGEPTHRVGSPVYPPFAVTRQAAIDNMVAEYEANSPGSCPQAWQYDSIKDGEPDTAT